MAITRYGVGEIKGPGGMPLPFARAVQADGWLYVSGRLPNKDGEIIDGGIVAQSHQAIQNMLAVVEEAGYTAADIVRVGVWLDDLRDFLSFNAVYAEYFAEHPPARSCVQSALVFDCKLEIECVAYKS
jgi:reactive intermediate/imine deaminase